MTKKEMFAHIATVCSADAEIVDFCNHEIELLGRKRTSSKPTKTQVENEAIKAEILEILGECDSAVTVKELIGLMGGKYTSQKLSALLRQLGESGTGQVVKTMEKKVSYFALA